MLFDTLICSVAILAIPAPVILSCVRLEVLKAHFTSHSFTPVYPDLSYCYNYLIGKAPDRFSFTSNTYGTSIV
jgi:hypothetical protein